MASIFRQMYTLKDENGKRIRKKSKFWYIDFKTADGTRSRIKAFKDKQATAQLAAKLEKEAELAQAGVVDRYKEHRLRPLIEHVEDFYKSLLAKGGRSLVVSSFDFDNYTVTIQAGYSKHRRRDELPLRPDTAATLKAFFKGELTSAQAFNVPDKPVKMFRKDLEDAKIPYVDESGRYADFHSLRHTTGSLLAASGAHPKIAQTLMRHCDINLTMNRYTHSYSGQVNEAITKLPDLSLPSSKSQKSTATGTDRRALESDSRAYKKLAKNAYSGLQGSALFDTENGTNKEEDTSESGFDKSLQMTTLGAEENSMSACVTDKKANAPGRTRTCNLRIRSPRLYPIELRAPKFLSA